MALACPRDPYSDWPRLAASPSREGRKYNRIACSDIICEKLKHRIRGASSYASKAYNTYTPRSSTMITSKTRTPVLRRLDPAYIPTRSMTARVTCARSPQPYSTRSRANEASSPRPSSGFPQRRTSRPSHTQLYWNGEALEGFVVRTTVH
jgi:hypothetical protein